MYKEIKLVTYPHLETHSPLGKCGCSQTVLQLPPPQVVFVHINSVIYLNMASI